jgi:predicted small secreted protein
MRAVLFAALILAACASPAGGAGPDVAQLPQHIREDLAQREAALAQTGVVAAGIGQTADLGGGLRVRPLEVLEDSRCPQNARCIWAGRLRVRVAVEGVGDREVILDEAAVQTQRGAFALVAATPGPWTDWPNDGRPPYRFGFRKS